jgi:hypothetical protein
VPADAQAVRCDLHELALRAYPFKEHHQLQPEEHHRIDARAPHGGGVAVGHQFPDECEIELLLKAAVEVVFGNKLFEGDVLKRGEVAFLDTHHEGDASYGW